MKTRRRTLWLAACVLAALAWSWWMLRDSPRTHSVSRAAHTESVVVPTKADVQAPTKQPPSAAEVKKSPATPTAAETYALPEPKRRAPHRVWVQAKLGRNGGAPDELGNDYLGGGGLTYVPQGFVVTPQGTLMVMDSNRKRVVEYERAGRMLRTFPVDLQMPGDIAVAADGTILVADLPNMNTGGVLLFKPDGTLLRKFPSLQPDELIGMYAAGNDFYFQQSDGSVKAGDTSGAVSDEAKGVYRDEETGAIPGVVAPDGRTVLHLGAELEDIARGEFYVSAVRGNPPEHLFTRRFVWPRPLAAIQYIGADARGQLYVVVLDSPRPQRYMLICLDSAGLATGVADMGVSNTGVGEQLRVFTVDPSGGLVFQRLSEVAQAGGSAAESIAYEWYDCH